jgi:hypothetical protein
VLFEAGLAMGRHAEKAVLVQIGKVKTFSDVAGRHIVKLSEATESRNDLANRLEKIGFKVAHRDKRDITVAARGGPEMAQNARLLLRNPCSQEDILTKLQNDILR